MLWILDPLNHGGYFSFLIAAIPLFGTDLMDKTYPALRIFSLFLIIEGIRQGICAYIMANVIGYLAKVFLIYIFCAIVEPFIAYLAITYVLGCNWTFDQKWVLICM
eukprot:UN33499